MSRMLLGCVALVLIPLPSRADSTVTETEMVIRLNVQPMPAPKPALKYLLLPELKELSPGNPIPNYLKSVLIEEAAGQDDVSRAALKQADRAARMDKPDWQILLKMRTDGISLLLPDVQKMRMLAAGYQIRFREEVTQRRFDDAVVTAKSMFALSRHMGEHPTLIGNLVAVAIATIAIGPFEEMLEKPGCPNFYWALTNLPYPLISMARGLEGERMLIGVELRDLDSNNPMTKEKLKKLIEHLDIVRGLAAAAGGKTEKTRDWLDARIKDEKLIAAARARLAASGLAEDRVKLFPAEQVILLDEKREYEERRDDLVKLMVLPVWQVGALDPQPKQAEKPALFQFLLPALYKVRLAQGRLEQRISLLRHIEALRLYAADYGGKWPEKLADINVPLPVDPFTGKPFRYKLEVGVAHVYGQPPRGMEKVPVYNLHYELTIQK